MLAAHGLQLAVGACILYILRKRHCSRAELRIDSTDILVSNELAVAGRCLFSQLGLRPNRVKGKLRVVDIGSKKSYNVVLGHAALEAKVEGRHECPLLGLEVRGLSAPSRRPHIVAAVVVILIDTTGRVLLTRRCASMRTFPSAWVLPGGKVDPGESLVTAGMRELKEETNLEADPDSFRMVAAWESVFPTTWFETKEVAAHYFVAGFVAVVKDHVDPVTNIKLQPAEADRAAWVDSNHVLDAVYGRTGGNLDTTMHGVIEEETHVVEEDLQAEQLRGIYPNEVGEGLGQAHLFLLEEASTPLPQCV